jgi:hypothetical protein
MRSTITLAIVGLALGCWNTAALSQADLSGKPNLADLKSAGKNSFSTLRSSPQNDFAKADVRALKAEGAANFSGFKNAQKNLQRSPAQPVTANREDLAGAKTLANKMASNTGTSRLKGLSALSRKELGAGTPGRIEHQQTELVNKFHR